MSDWLAGNYVKVIKQWIHLMRYHKKSEMTILFFANLKKTLKNQKKNF